MDKSEVLLDILKEVNNKTDAVILKGGASLIFCYGLPRLTDDLDFNSNKVNLGNLLKRYSERKNYTFKVTKDTDTVKRYIIGFGEKVDDSIKIEVSYRQTHIPQEEVTIIEGIKTYTIDQLLNQKILAYMARDKLRDVYDIFNILNDYEEDISDKTKGLLAQAFHYKDLNTIYTIIETQEADGINKEELENLVDSLILNYM